MSSAQMIEGWLGGQVGFVASKAALPCLKSDHGGRPSGNRVGAETAKDKPAAILLPRGTWAVAMLVVVLAYIVLFLGADLFALVQSGPWPLGNAMPRAAPPA